MTYIKGTNTENIIKCDNCKSIIGYSNDEVYLEKTTYFSLDINENKLQVKRLIHCPSCGTLFAVSEIKQE